MAQGHLKGSDQQVSQPHLEAGQQREGPAGHAGGDDEGRAVAAVHGQGAAAHGIGRQDHDLVPLEEQGARGQDQQAGGDAHPEIGPEGAEEGEVGAVPCRTTQWVTVWYRAAQAGPKVTRGRESATHKRLSPTTSTMRESVRKKPFSGSKIPLSPISDTLSPGHIPVSVIGWETLYHWNGSRGKTGVCGAGLGPPRDAWSRRPFPSLGPRIPRRGRLPGHRAGAPEKLSIIFRTDLGCK